MKHPYTPNTQRESIKQFLLQGNSLTPLEALSLFGAYRLAAQVEYLKKKHKLNIVTTMNTDSTGRRYARYHIPNPVVAGYISSAKGEVPVHA